ncbi:uncharacterized protein LOC119734001 [Patiria miniata]|uniref:Uncharacterized protein n=1 Tax=Patiria miniata TaxID=46514 RepID=A0A914AH52_PATMI|nr:uncharacterized protein LOC119734001 [Patiria miniata]
MEAALDLSVISPKSQKAADFFRDLVSEILPDLLGHVEGVSNQDRADRVKQALQNISRTYRCKLGNTDTWSRSEWDNAANRCAYVFLYYMHHCHMVYVALQPLLEKSLSHVVQRWRQMKYLQVCCIGGGPGPDLVGLTKFLRDTDVVPVGMLKCSVIDAFPSWKTTWDAIREKLPDPFPVNYFRCDLVRDTAIEPDVLDIIRRVDLVTLVKCFSAVAAFMRDDPRRSSVFQAILRELKPGAVVLYIDNEKNQETWQCFSEITRMAGLDVLHEWHGKPVIPSGEDSAIIQNYSSALELRPMQSCVVSVVLLRKNRPTLSLVRTTDPNKPAVVTHPGVPSRNPYLETRLFNQPDTNAMHVNGHLQVEWPYRKLSKQQQQSTGIYAGGDNIIVNGLPSQK